MNTVAHFCTVFLCVVCSPLLLLSQVSRVDAGTPWYGIPFVPSERSDIVDSFSGMDVYEGDNNGIKIVRDADPYQFLSGNVQASGDEFWEVPVPTMDGPAYWDIETVVAEGSSIYVGGRFTEAGGVPVRNVARYNMVTARWEALGSGEENGTNAVVNAIAVRDGKVYVGGRFSEAGGMEVSGIAVYDEQTGAWSDMEGGVGSGAGSPFVRALALDDAGNLYAGGRFTTVAGIPASNLAQWNGTVWEEVEGGVQGSSNAEVTAILTVGTNVYVGGSFPLVAGDLPANGIACWNGRSWETLGQGLWLQYATVRGITAGNDGEVIVYGRGLDQNNDGWLHALTWNGSQWFGIRGLSTENLDASMVIEDLKIDHQERVVVVGRFDRIEGQYVNNVARLDPSGWKGVGDGIYYDVNVVVLDGAGMIVGGGFNKAGTIPAQGLARWNGDAWAEIGGGLGGGYPGWFGTVAEGQEGRLYVGGLFQQIGSVPASNVAEWTGSEWRPLGNGLNGLVYTLAVGPDGAVYAGGQFSRSGDNQMLSIAKWNGSEWLPLLNDTWRSVQKIRFYGSRLIAAGQTQGAGASVAEFTGDSWNVIGGEADPIPVIHNFVNAALINDFRMSGDDLYIAGRFITLNDEAVEATNVARWDGTEWHALGLGAGIAGDAGEFLNALALEDDKVYAGGLITRAGGNVASGIARWSETDQRWVNFNGGIVSSSGRAFVRDLEFIGSDLVIAGFFNRIAGTDAASIAAFNGSSLRPLGSGVAGSVTDIASADAGDFYVAGSLITAGEQVTPGIARWTEILTSVEEQTESNIDGSVQLVSNPVRERATLNVNLSSPSSLQVTVYSTDGQEVATVVDRRYEAGHHVIEWVPESAVPGMYFYRVKTESGITTGSMVVVQ